MTISKWKVAIEDLGLPAPQKTDPPEGRDGGWYDALTRFARRGFARLLVSEEEALQWYLEAAHPAIDAGVAAAASAAFGRACDSEWSFELDDDHLVRFSGSSAPEDAPQALVPLLLFADAVTADRDDLGDLVEMLEKVESSAAASEAPGDLAQQVDAGVDAGVDGGQEVDAGQDAAASAGEGSATPFETIGEADAAPTGPVFDIAVTDGAVELGIGLPDRLDAETFDRALEAWGRSLRGRYDVQTRQIRPDEDRELDLGGATTRLMLRVEPDALEGSLTTADIAPGLQEHLATLSKVSDGGIDPLVFLGVRTSAERSAPSTTLPDEADEAHAGESGESSGSSRFEAIGDSEAEETADAPTDDADEVTFFVEEGPDEPPGGGLVLDLAAPLAADAPLEAGRFDDPRLAGVDATTQLVDVVLRHPGYSDRNIGQVLSILLSIDYSDALELAASAPRVIAWSVGNDRANTMKTVIEGAGGKVRLVEPDTFNPR